MTNLAGIFALGVAAFPTTAEHIIKRYLRSFVGSETVGWIHDSFAAAPSYALISNVIIVKGIQSHTQRRRNLWYILAFCNLVLVFTITING
jgi:hypothetical protein